jgi:AraC-like DNA-binding protein
VTFCHTTPLSASEHRRLLGPTVRFNQPKNAVAYRTAALQAGLLSADPALLRTFEVDAEQRLGRIAPHAIISERLRSILASRLNGEVPSLRSVASDLAMSERSLQRSLSEEHTTYRALVDDVRKRLALAHLSRPGALATDVALLLGFSEASAFTRAFRRWTGSSPTEFRRA